jgi:transposase
VIKTALSQIEISILQSYASSPVELIRLKALAVMARNRYVPLPTLSEMFNRSERVITRWIGDYSKRKLSSIFSGKVGNENAGKLTKEQKEEIKSVIGEPPNDQGIPKEFWDVPKLKNYVQARFGIVYESEISYHFLLRFSGLTIKYPDKLSPRRNDKLIIKRIKEIRKEIKPLLKDPSWVVLATDETRLQLEAEIRRAWLVKGRRTIVKSERSDEHQNYLGFLDQKDGACEVYPIKRGNQTETIKVLKQVMKKNPDKKVCVIWDNAKWHNGKVLRAELAKQTQLKNLYLINFPPYAPDYNPIEHVWEDAKGAISNRGGSKFETIKREFLNHITSRQFKYKIRLHSPKKRGIKKTDISF